MEHEIDSIKKHKCLAEHTIKTRLDNYCPHISMEKIFMNMESNKTSEPHKSVLNLLQRLDLTSSTKHVALQNIPIYYTWKNIRKHNKNNKLKIIASTTNDESELPDGSYLVSAIQDYIGHIIKNMKYYLPVLLIIFKLIGLIID